MLTQAIQKLMLQDDLSEDELNAAFKDAIEVNNIPQISAFLALLKAKGETEDELHAIVKILRSKMHPVNAPVSVLDIVGTGGDGKQTVNISTASSLLIAMCGVKTVKHGNRSVSSKAGSADFLEALGYNIHLNAVKIPELLEACNYVFCFAQNFHPVMKSFAPIRKALGVPTCFNLMGPLLNPANPAYMMLGVANPNYVKIYAKLLQRQNVQRGLVFHCAGTDELCTAGNIVAAEINQDQIIEENIDPRSFGFQLCQIEDLKGGDAVQNVELIKRSFSGEESPITDALILNTAYALYLSGLQDSVTVAIEEVKEILSSGQVLAKLGHIVECSHKLGAE